MGLHDDQVRQLQNKILELEAEKKEFGSQRAKMKSLMLQNEGRFFVHFNQHRYNF